ncbi:DUF4834 family protein [Flavobacterium columnare]|uniref:DUF4834 family protein n=1 Tax=Flavobacterium columnare TaxID=996 RepID=UPI003C2E2B9C
MIVFLILLKNKLKPFKRVMNLFIFEKKIKMQEASISGLFKTIIYILGFYYLIKILSRIFLPIIMRKVMDKAQENLNRQYQKGNFEQSEQETTYRQEGSNRDLKKPTKQVGEYVDYEEVE